MGYFFLISMLIILIGLHLPQAIRWINKTPRKENKTKKSTTWDWWE